MADSDAPQNKDAPPDFLAMIGRGVVPPVLHDRARRAEMGLPEDDDTPGRYMVELNILYRGGLREAAKAFEELCKSTPKLGDTVISSRRSRAVGYRRTRESDAHAKESRQQVPQRQRPGNPQNDHAT